MKFLAQKIRIGIKFSLFEKVITLLLGLIQLFIVVRFISEREIGLMALVNTILIFANQLFELGIGNSILHRQDTTQEQLSSIYWWQIILSVITFFILLLIATPFSRLYEASELKWMLYILSFTVIINSLGQSFSAILYRDLHFVILSKMRILVTISGFITVVLFALLGFGIWALILGHLIKSILQSLLLNYQGRKVFSPNFYFNFKEIRPHISFGLYQTGESFVTLLIRQLDTLIIGKFLGSEVLGIYDIIKQLLAKVFRLVNSIITSILLPVFARFQNDEGKVSNLYLRQIRLLSSLNFPFYLFAAFNAEVIFLIILNPVWLTPANQQLFTYLSLYFLVASLQNPLGTLLISHGKVRQSFWYNLGAFLMLSVTLLWSVQESIVFTSQALLLFTSTTLIASYYLLLRQIVNFSLKTYLKNLTSPLLISLFSIFLADFATGLDLFFIPPYLLISLEVIIAILCYSIMSRYWNKIVWEEIIKMIKSS